MNDEKQKRIEFSDLGSERLPEEISSDIAQGAKSRTPGHETPGSGDADPGSAPPSADDAETPDAAGRSSPGEPGASLRSEETVGEMLLASRERSGQTLEFMSQETKIPKQMLQYLETDNFEALPAKVYVKSFLRTYALALGLDVQHLLGKYEFQTGQTHRTKGDRWEIETEVVEEKLRSPVAMRTIFIAAAVVIAVVLIVKFAGRSTDRSEPPPPSNLAEELLEKRDARPPAPPVEMEGAADAEVPIAEPMELRITASPTDSCWIELETLSIVDQQPESAAFAFNLQPGRSRTFQATEEFLFRKIGNAGGIVIELNGGKLPALGRKGKVVTNYSVTREQLPKDANRE